MAFTDDVAAAFGIVNAHYERASAIARNRNLSIMTNYKPYDGKSDGPGWTTVLELTGHEPEYRIGFSVHLSETFSKPSTARIWSLVDDLHDGSWQQFIRDDVPLAQLSTTLAEALATFETYLQVNDGLDPIEMAKQRARTDYYWHYEHKNDCYSEYTTFFDDDWVGCVAGHDDDWEGILSDPDGTERLCKNDTDPVALIKKIEAAYKDAHDSHDEGSDS